MPAILTDKKTGRPIMDRIDPITEPMPKKKIKKKGPSAKDSLLEASRKEDPAAVAADEAEGAQE